MYGLTEILENGVLEVDKVYTIPYKVLSNFLITITPVKG